MTISEQDLQRLTANPRETIDLELKEWLDPDSPEGKAKIARACIALFNANGGFLIIGFTDDGQIASNQPANARETYHPDVIQGIVSKFASQPIALDVHFVEREGVTFPVIRVPAGVTTPCAAKSELRVGKEKPLIKDQAVYVRSVSSNNTVSTSEPRVADWERLVRICHDNREADIGRFLRRHLSGLNLDALRELLNFGPPEPSLDDRTKEFLDTGFRRFNAQLKKRGLSLPGLATFEASIIVEGEFPSRHADTEFYLQLQLNKPRHTGWPPWIDARNFQGPEGATYVNEGGWECFIRTKLMGDILDFWRAEPIGRFYHLRGLEDDSHWDRGINPSTLFDFALHTGRIAEVVSIGTYFARALGAADESTFIGFACRFTGLEGRVLQSWSSPDRLLRSRSTAVQDAITTTAVLPLESASLVPTVEQLIAPVLALFDGTKLHTSVIEGIVSEVINRRM